MTQFGEAGSAMTFPAVGVAGTRTPAAKTAISHQARAKRRIFIGPDLPRCFRLEPTPRSRNRIYACAVAATAAIDARRVLFEGLIDHAPTFPPEELPLDEGLAE